MPHVELTDALCTCGVEDDVARALAYELTGEAHTETYPWYAMRVGVTSSLRLLFFLLLLLAHSTLTPLTSLHPRLALAAATFTLASPLAHARMGTG